MTQIFD